MAGKGNLFSESACLLRNRLLPSALGDHSFRLTRTAGMESCLSDRRLGVMLLADLADALGACRRKSGEENDDEAILLGNGGVTRERGRWWGTRCAVSGGRGAGGESGDDDGERAIDAVRKKYGGGRRCHAGREIWF